jgi:hypothetical protein
MKNKKPHKDLFDPFWSEAGRPLMCFSHIKSNRVTTQYIKILPHFALKKGIHITSKKNAISRTKVLS